MPKVNSKTMKHHQKISIETLPNGYAMTVDGKEYLYFNVEDLIAGFFTHVAIEKTEYLDKDMVEGLMIAAATWKTVGDALSANATLIASARKANNEANIAEHGQARANERADEALKELNRVKRENMELKADVLHLQTNLERIGKAMVNNHKSRVTASDTVRPSSTYQRVEKAHKKTGKGRYARKG